VPRSVHRTSLAVTCGAILVGAVVWFVALGGSGAAARVASRSGHVSPVLLRNFAILRRPAARVTTDGSAGAVSPSLATDFQIIASGPRAKYGIVTADARYISVAGSDAVQGLRLLPGSSGMCVIDMVGTPAHPGGGSCASTAEAASGLLLGIDESLSPSNAVQATTIAGVVPNGYSSVTAVDSGGSSAATAPVSNNAYVVNATGFLASVRLTSASGSTRTVDLRARPAERAR
jgi:hypothetical protein